MTTNDEDHEGFKTAYLVRLKPDQRYPRELVGVFVADSFNQLLNLVDECTDVDACEYLILPSGGILAGGRANLVPAPRSMVEQADFNPLMGASISELWEDQFFGDNDDRHWTALALGAANDLA